MKSITVLKLKLRPHSSDALNYLGETCRRGRNAASVDWLMRQHGKAETDRQKLRHKKMSEKERAAVVARGGDPDNMPKSETSKMYAAILDAVPELSGTMASALANAVNALLSANVDWRRGLGEGKRPKRRDAIMSMEDRPPWFTSLEIPAMSRSMTIKVGSELKLVLSPTLRDTSIEVEILQGSLPPRIKKVICELASGERKLADSKLVRKDDDWYLHIPVTYETEVSSDIEATLSPTIGSDRSRKQLDRPFLLALPSRQRGIGDGDFLLRQTLRLVGLRKDIGWRYRQRCGAGHGRKKVDAAVRRRREQERNIRTEVRRRMIADVVRSCVRDGVGKLTYKEPSLPLRKKCWFSAVGLEWDWTRFANDLKNACARQGIEVTVKQWKWKDAA